VSKSEELLRDAVELEGTKKLAGGQAVGKLEKERRKVDKKRCEEELRRSRKVSEEDVALTVVGCLKKETGSGKDEMRMVQAIVAQLKTSLEKESGEFSLLFASKSRKSRQADLESLFSTSLQLTGRSRPGRSSSLCSVGTSLLTSRISWTS